jgi:hypothetical protein
MGTAKLRPAVEKYTPIGAMSGDAAYDLPLSERGGIVVRRFFPADAEYSLLVRIRGNLDPNMPSPRLDLRVDGVRVKLFDISISAAEEAQNSRNYEIRIPLKAGNHTISAGCLNELARGENGVQSRGRNASPTYSLPSVDYLLVGGPFNPTGPGETESRRRIFLCRPKPGESEEPCATRIVTSLARQAYRRPVTDSDIKPLLKLFASGRQEGGSFESGIEEALRAILVSPSFLFRVERAPESAKGVHPVTDLELASRLSFFLWSSIPDEELLRVAEAGQLRAQLDTQVARMLRDAKANALVENFAGQWLHLRNVSGWRPDPDKFPQFDDSLRNALQRETELLFQYIMRADRSVLDLVNADYSFLNERLARHYGITGIRGGQYRKVDLPDSKRGGILTHASILTVTSYPTRTSPVLRGKWILENVLGAPPPPPPPDVPNLAESANVSASDLRKALEQHRANAACASCHSRLDPLGFSLENYDAVGRYRAKEGGVEIDASGALPGGITIRGAGDLKRIMVERRDEFVECLAEKLLTYALGRGLESYDQPTIREIRRATARDEYRFSALVLATVHSVPFQMRRTPER